MLILQILQIIINSYIQKIQINIIYNLIFYPIYIVNQIECKHSGKYKSKA